MLGVVEVVVAVQEGDALHVSWNRRQLVDVAEQEAATATMSGEADARRHARQFLLYALKNRGQTLLRIFLPPGRPAFQIVLQVGHRDIPVAESLSQQARLGPDMLDVEVPVETRAGASD